MNNLKEYKGKYRIRHTEKWFKNRVKKFVHSKRTNTDIEIDNELHAHVLFTYQQEMGSEYLDCRKVNESLKK